MGVGFRSLNVSLRQELDLYVCLRPVRYFKGVPSPVKRPDKIDMVIFRENTEDIYAGIEFREGSEEVEQFKKVFAESFPKLFKKIRFPGTSGLGIKPISREGSERLIRAASSAGEWCSWVNVRSIVCRLAMIRLEDMPCPATSEMARPCSPPAKGKKSK